MFSGKYREIYNYLEANLEKLDNDKMIAYKVKFINSFRVMSSLLSSLVDKSSAGLHDDKCKDCNSYLDYTTIKDNNLFSKCFECKKLY